MGLVSLCENSFKNRRTPTWLGAEIFVYFDSTGLLFMQSFR